MERTMDGLWELQLSRHFETVSLEDLDRNLFDSRYDSKFLPRERLGEILAPFIPDYNLLTIGDRYIQHYRSLYFDDLGFKFYLDHQNGRLNRHKIRFRHYPETGHVFIEVKMRTNKNRSRKWRKEAGDSTFFRRSLSGEDRRFVGQFLDFDLDNLLPRLTVSYRRLALVHRSKNERVTIDVDLRFQKDNDIITLPGISVIELKQPTPSVDSCFSRLIRPFHLRPTRFSKYCFGVCRHYPSLKHNRFKPRHLFLQKLQQGGL